MLGAACPQLRRGDGTYNPLHGTWSGRAELPPGPVRRRVTIRFGGFPTQAKMEAWFTDALRLLSIPDDGPDGHAERLEILAMIRQSRAEGAALPDFDDLRRRHAYGAAYRPGTTGEFLLSWLEARREAGDIAPKTLAGYAAHIERIWLPQIGEVPLDKLRPHHITRAFAAIDAESERITAARASGDPAERKAAAGRRPTGPATRQRIRATLRKALADARRAGLISMNPAAGEALVLKTGQKTRLLRWTGARERAWRAGYEKRLAGIGGDSARTAARFRAWQSLEHRPGPSMVWRLDHLGAFLDHVAQDRLYPLWHLAAYRGLRRGELAGLRWEDVDLASGTLTVRTARVTVGWQVIDTTPKSAASEATIGLAAETVQVLSDWWTRQADEREAWGEAYRDSGLVFTREDGTPWHPDYLTTRFEHEAWRAGLPPIRFHDLRHGTATLAHAAGANLRDIQALLRHSSYVITADLYTAVLEEHDLETAERMSRMVPRRPAEGQRDGVL